MLRFGVKEGGNKNSPALKSQDRMASEDQESSCPERQSRYWRWPGASMNYEMYNFNDAWVSDRVCKERVSAVFRLTSSPISSE